MRFGALIAAIVIAGCTRPAKEAPSGQPTPEPLADVRGAVEPTAAEAGYVGVLTPRDTAEITAQFTTDVTEFKVKLGDHVEVGDVIALLDEQPLREQLAIMKAELKASKAEVAHASVSRKAAKAALKREKDALKESVASRADVDQAQYKSREAGTVVARAAATVEEQKARIAALESKLSDMTIKAPIAGKVSLRYVEPGSRVQEGEPVVRVISSDKVFVKFAIPAEHVGKLKPGDEVEVMIESRGMKVKAVVRSVAPELDPVAQMIVAEADLAETPGEPLQSGLVCRIHPYPAPESARTN